jgi:hypothetical protein
MKCADKERQKEELRMRHELKREPLKLRGACFWYHRESFSLRNLFAESAEFGLRIEERGKLIRRPEKQN